MPLSNEQIIRILDENPIEGLDYTDGLNRLSNQASIYLRIVNTFVKSTPDLLEELARVTPETIADYTIRIHGLKGSCYSIGAMAPGDEAKALELAAKAFDWDTIEQDNQQVIEQTNRLIDQLQAVLDKTKESEANF